MFALNLISESVVKVHNVTDSFVDKEAAKYLRNAAKRKGGKD